MNPFFLVYLFPAKHFIKISSIDLSFISALHIWRQLYENLLSCALIFWHQRQIEVMMETGAIMQMMLWAKREGLHMNISIIPYAWQKQDCQLNITKPSNSNGPQP